MGLIGPPWGEDRALDAPLVIEDGALFGKGELLAAIEGHVFAEAELIGLYER